MLSPRLQWVVSISKMVSLEKLYINSLIRKSLSTNFRYFLVLPFIYLCSDKCMQKKLQGRQLFDTVDLIQKVLVVKTPMLRHFNVKL